MQFLLSFHLFRLQTVQTEGRIFFLPGRRLHQMQVQCVRYLYHQTWLRRNHRLQSDLFCAVLLLLPLRMQIKVHTLCILNLYLYSFLKFRKLLLLHFLRNLILFPEALLPYSKYSRQQLLLLHRFLQGLHKVLR